MPSRDEDDYPTSGLGDVRAARVRRHDRLSLRFRARAPTTASAGIRRRRRGRGDLAGSAEVSVSLGPWPVLPPPTISTPISAVDADQSAASGLPEFEPDGGLKGVGLEAEARYALTPAWSVVANAGYERLVGDAAEFPSPMSAAKTSSPPASASPTASGSTSSRTERVSSRNGRKPAKYRA